MLPMLLVGNGIVGGMEEYVLSMIRYFRQHEQPVLVGAPFQGEFTEALLLAGHAATDLYFFEMSEQLHISSLAELCHYVRARRVDLIHSHLLAADVLGAAAAAWSGIPAISTLHGTRQDKEWVLLHRLYGLEYITVSQAGAETARASGIPPTAVSYIPNGIDPARFDPARGERDRLRASLGVRDDQLLVVCVCRLAPEKDPRGFLEVANLAGLLDTRLVFALVGSGPQESMLRQLATVSPVSERFQLLGTRRDIPEILAAADIAVLTSRSESLPFAILEAMAMELPVIASDVGGVREALRDGEHGYLIRQGDTPGFATRVLELAAAPDKRRQLGRAARVRVLEAFVFDRSMQRVLEVYQARIRANGRHPARLQVTTGWASPAESRAPAVGPDLPQVVDSHLHLSGEETAEQVIESLDGAGIDQACLIGPFIRQTDWSLATGVALQRANDYLLECAAAAPDRLIALVTVDPQNPAAARQLESYAKEATVGGVKLIPNGWRPDDRKAAHIYEACDDLGLTILFHSGIFIGARHSDVCRPALYEAVRDYPKLRIVLAHLGWPWVDEAIAVAFMDLLKGRSPQIFLDTSPGTPPIYRKDALEKALRVLGSSVLLFGSDRFFPVPAASLHEQLTGDRAALYALGANAADLERIFAGNALRLFSSQHLLAARLEAAGD